VRSSASSAQGLWGKRLRTCWNLEGEGLPDLVLRLGGGVGGGVLQRHAAVDVRRLRVPAGPAVGAGRGGESPGHPLAPGVEGLHPRELREGVLDLGRGGGPAQGEKAEVVVAPRGGVAAGVLLRHLLEGGPRLLRVRLHLHPVAADLEHGLPDRVGIGKARDHDVEVVEGLLRLALRAVSATVLEEAAGLHVLGLLGGDGHGHEEQRHEEVEAPMVSHVHSFGRPTTKVGAPPFTSTACSDFAPSGQRKATVCRPAAIGRSRIGG
jgi:hypothetical protein